LLAKNREWYSKNREARIAQTREYHQSHPEMARAATAKWRANNKQKVQDYARQYASDNRERFREWARQSRERHFLRCIRDSHRYRAKALGQEDCFTIEEWLSLLEDCNWSCVCCGTHADEIKAIYPRRKRLLEVDHIVPVSRGGVSLISNIQPLCQACNNHKRAQTIDYRPASVRAKYSVAA
jgi:5-methylcytosine-specific restriction endonuclease McrA